MSRHINPTADRAMKAIKIQLLKTGLLIALMVILVFKQYDFLYHAIAAHPELNLLIIGIFLFGIIVAVRSIISLLNDERGLRWMKESYSDLERIDEQPGDHDLTRLLRVSTRAKLFSFPRIIGQVFELAMEELMQNRSFHISLAQRNSMMGMVQESINREKSLVNYLTGVMILLGLIGTFIGLMEMVASVGGIVGGLAKAGSGSDEAIKGVIKDLEAPLTGMATGFSASLFGLLGSLVLGLVARFGQTATLAIKHDLEHWLSRISQLETQRHSATADSGQASGAAVSSLAISLVGSFRTIQGILIRSSDVMRKLADRQDMQTEAVNRLVASIDGLSLRQEQALWQLRRVDAIGDSVEAMRSDAILSEKSLGNRLTSEFGKIADLVEQFEARQADRFGDIGDQHRVTERLARSLEVQAARGFEDLAMKSSAILTDQAELKRLLHEGQDVIVQRMRDQTKSIDVTGVTDRLGAAVDERLAAGFGAIAMSLDRSLGKLAESLHHFGAAQSDVLKKLDGITSHRLADEMRNLSKTIEEGLSSGFADLSRILDVVITNQAVMATTHHTGEPADSHLAPFVTWENEVRDDGKEIPPQRFAAFKNALRSSSDSPSGKKN